MNQDPPQDDVRTMEQLLEDRRLTEQALREAVARWQGIVEAAVDGIIAIDERGTIDWVNPAALAIFGYAANDVVGRNVKMLMPEPYHSEHDEYLRRYLETDQRKIIGIGREVQGRRKDGSVFPMDLAVSEVKIGSRRLFTGIIRDITVRKQIERDLVEARDQAVAASMAKDQLIAVVSHELRTPLNPVLVAVSYLEKRPDLPEDAREEISAIRRNIEHEARLVEDLLNLTRLAGGKIELHQEAVDAHALLRTALLQFQEDLAEKGIQLMTSMQAKPHFIWADPMRMRQVLTNLLANAAKFTPKGGRIAVTTTNTADGRLRFEVTDSGIGIEPEVLAKLFKPFEQGGAGVARKYGGLGLGLAISKGIVELHGGKLSAHSAGKGQGATFAVELAVVGGRAGIGEPEAAQSGLGRRVLLVEDHRDTLRVMVKLLKSIGYRVIPAASVGEALQIAEHEPFDVLLSDIGLPDGTGLDLLRQIAARMPVKAIALSGYSQEDDRLRSKQAGFLEHLSKPVDFEQLESVLRRVAG